MALPSVMAITTTPPPLLRTDARPINFERNLIVAQDGAEWALTHHGRAARVHELGISTGKPMSVVLPLDALFDIRVAAARRLWLMLQNREPGNDSAVLSTSQCKHFVNALRALDGYLAHASYREIASVLFGAERIPSRGWKSHDLRDRTIRLVRLGNDLMQGGYRQLLLYPFRQRLP
jgi:hypothetical protein